MLLTKDNYLKFFSMVDQNHIKENYRELHYLYVCLKELREKLPEHNFTTDELSSYFWVKYPDAKKDIYETLFEQIAGSEISDEAAGTILSAIQKRQALLKLSELAYEASQGRVEISDVQTLAVGLVTTVSESPEDCFVTTDLEALVNNVVRTRGIRFRLQCLNRSLGSLRQGDFGFVFARPETGKTTFLADVAGYSFDQVESPVVWFLNEERGQKVMLRIYQSYFGVDLTTLIGNIKRYNAEFKARVGDKFRLVDSASIDRPTVERVLQSVKPSLIIYDQIDKIKGFKADRDDLVLGQIYQWARELAKTYAPSIGVCQADGTAEGQKWLTMAHVSNAKTSKQAEADWILGIGRTHDEAAEYIRYLNISKNKLLGDVDSIPEMRHGRFETVMLPEIARFKDIVDYS